MIIIDKTFAAAQTYPLSRLGAPEGLAFFDIETTGLSPDYSIVYLIGVFYPQGDGFRFLQWFAESKKEEPLILDAFFRFIQPFHTLVHFNGDTFDLPFLKKRAEKHTLSCPLSDLASVDLYRRIKPFKKLLGLDSLKQKSIEAFLKIRREDQYTGGQLIEVYHQYEFSRKEELRGLLLLHNEDDLKGMPALLPILFYPDFFSQDFRLLDMKKQGNHMSRLVLTLQGMEEISLPVPLSVRSSSYELTAKDSLLTLSVRLYEGTLKYFYPNYKDYYYLIYEDTAVHKSVGEFVDRGARVKATRETCYTKKEGIFLPQPAPLWTPSFQNAFRDKTYFFEFEPERFSDTGLVNAYIKDILSFLNGHPV